MNSRTLTRTPEIDTAGKERFKLQVEAFLQERAEQETARSIAGGSPSRGLSDGTTRRTLEQTRGMLDDMGLDDFAVYIFSPSMRQAILAEFYKVVEPLLEEQKPFDLVTHSWGTVIAYEGLRALEQHGFDTPPIACWFTVGAALSIAPVCWSLPAPNNDGHKPKLVRRWINIDAQGDGVGGSLHPHYAVDDEFLEQVPTGCTEGFFGYDLRCAHGSYFRTENLVVNKNLYAKFLLGVGS